MPGQEKELKRDSVQERSRNGLRDTGLPSEEHKESSLKMRHDRDFHSLERSERIREDMSEIRKSERKSAGRIRKELEEGYDNTVKSRDGDSDAEEVSEEAEYASSDHSARMGQLRETSARSTSNEAQNAGLRHDRHKKLAQKYHVDDKRKSRLSETEKETDLSIEDFKENIQKSQKAKRTARLAFDDETPEGVMVRGSGQGFGRKGARVAAGAGTIAAGAVHSKIAEAEDENAAVEASHAAERLSEESVRKSASAALRHERSKMTASRRIAESGASQKLRFAGGEQAAEEARAVNEVKGAKQEAQRKTTIRKFFQKQRIRRRYAAAKYEEKTVQQTVRQTHKISEKAARVVKEIFRRNSKILLAVGLLGLFFLITAAALGSCAASIQGAGSTVIGTTYVAEDDEIHKVEDRYEELERQLNEQINNIESRNSQYSTFRYQIDEISHNPYHLISYFTTKYGEFTYRQVKDELEDIFKEQYGLSTEGDRTTETSKKTVKVGESLGNVVTSGYCNCSICCGRWAGGPTASGAYPKSNHTIAVDANNPFVPMGTHVVMNGVEYVVEDTGAFARYGVQFDVYYGSHSEASAHGHKTWEAFIADSNGSREVEVTTTETVNRLSVVVTNHDLNEVLKARLSKDEKVRYELYNKTLGNRDYLFDLDKIPTYTVHAPAGGGYSIPPEALSDQRFANMIHEAEKYLGYPYVWGGASPSTSFDCSGFVSWVINHCGNGWSYGRRTAEGLRQLCVRVSPSEAKPGDLIFFQGTYNTSGASHVGIYVGNGMMIHCGSPIQYTSIRTNYWQQHFLSYGRIP